MGEEIGAGAALPLTVVLPTKACKTAMPGGGTWVNFCLVCAAGLSEPLTHYSLLYGQL